MSGYQEGILIDLSEPTEESPVSLTESIEFMRDASMDVIDVPKYETPLKTVDDLLNLNVTESNSSSPRQPSPLRLIEDEEFDFDLPLTPGSKTGSSTAEDDEEEVFFGPVGYRERCVSTIVETVHTETKPLSPLKPHEIAEICKEANAVVCMIASAASGKKDPKAGKENKLCVKKQLNLGGKSENPILEVLGKSRRSVDTNIVSAGKDSCDSKLLVEADVCDDSINKLESFLKHEVVLQKPESKKKSASSGSDSCESPAKRHNRSGTFTKDDTPIDQLPADRRQSLPVVDKTDEESSAKKSGNRRSISKLQQHKPASKLTRSSIPGMNQPAPIIKQDPVNDLKPASTTQPKSRLSAPKAGAGSLLPSKTKPVASKLPTTSLPTKLQLPQKSALPGLKGRGAPISKLQLMKPNNSQRLAGLQPKTNTDSAKKTGPMKAFANTVTDTGATEVTPAKSESIICQSSYTNSTPPRKGGSIGSDSPMSSVKKRRSFLPTPNKSRSGSAGSCPSPCGSRTSSTSSMRSIESPLIGKRRPSTAANGPHLPFELIDDSSPSAMKQRRPLVTNTPNQPKKKISPWSPVQRKKGHDPFDQAFACTKIKRT